MTGLVSRGFFSGFAVGNKYEKCETRHFLYTATDVVASGVSTVIFVGSGQQDWMSGDLGVGGGSEKTKVGRD
jgi:hypothetical protein